MNSPHAFGVTSFAEKSHFDGGGPSDQTPANLMARLYDLMVRITDLEAKIKFLIALVGIQTMCFVAVLMVMLSS